MHWRVFALCCPPASFARGLSSSCAGSTERNLAPLSVAVFLSHGCRAVAAPRVHFPCSASLAQPGPCATGVGPLLARPGVPGAPSPA
eukprot:11129041-Lingulodinium_polyedra.AAC.1